MDSEWDGTSDEGLETCNAAIRASKLEKTYGKDDAVRAVDGVDFEIGRGTAVGLLGPNGAGKTTIMKCLLGLIVPTEGDVYLDGINLKKNAERIYHRVGATYEGARNMYWRLTVWENLNFFSAISGNKPSKRCRRHEELLHFFDIIEKKDTVVRELSRGQKQKAALACTLARDPDILLLDEPTLGLDVESTISLRNELQRLVKEDTTILLSSHDMDVIEDVCDRVLIIDEGHIIADSSVESLLEMFDTNRYRITVREQIHQSTKNHFQKQFNAEKFSANKELARFEVTIPADEFYALTDSLRDYSLTVERVETLTPDLKEVFLNVTEDGVDEGTDNQTTSSVNIPENPEDVDHVSDRKAKQ